MKKIHFVRLIIITLILIFTISILFISQRNKAPQEIFSLAGEWKFQLDSQNLGLEDEWFKTELDEIIQLPGSCEEQGYGFKNQERRLWGLTRIIKYEGKAWYQKEVMIPKAWEGKRVELFLERCHWESTVWVNDQLIDTRNSLSTPHQYDL